MRKLFVLAAFALVFAGCGEKHDYVHVAETEGIYVDVAGLTYQVQLSRFLNPGSIDDDEYLVGLPEGTTPTLPGDEIWFGVWMRVKNYSDDALPPATDFTIVDTEGNEFEPIELDVEINPFAYNPRPIPHAGILPVPNSAASSGPIQGSLILFRLKTDSLQNRPLRLEIKQGDATPAEIDLDL